MNRSILIVICDFLLLSLLAFSTVDVKKVGLSGESQLTQNPSASNSAPVTGRQDLGEVMRLALDEERKNRNQLANELTLAQAIVAQQNEQIQSVKGQLETKEQLAARLAREQANLQRQYSEAQASVTNLNEKLRASTIETVITKEQRAAMEAEARKNLDRAYALEKQLAELQKSNQLIASDKQALLSQLQLSAASNHYAAAQMAQLQTEVDAQRNENLRLAEGVKALATKSSELAREIHDNRELTPNRIFEDLSTNRVLASFTGIKPGFFGMDSSKEKQTELILITDETNIFALCHVQDTPLTLWNPGTQWEELRGTLSRGASMFPIQSLSFCMMDPRIVLLPIPAAEAHALGCKVYHLSKDPFIFQEAVVVGTRENYYGECKFQIDVSTPEYLKMDHNSIKGLFGKFNPSSGDLVLSKTGELLGVMANDSYCAIIRNFQPLAVFRFGPAGHDQPTAQTLSTLYTLVTELPFKLQ